MYYKAIGNKKDGWHIYRMDDNPDHAPVLIPRLVNGQIKPYPQRQGVFRRVKQLNDAVKNVDEMIKRDGAIIL